MTGPVKDPLFVPGVPIPIFTCQPWKLGIRQLIVYEFVKGDGEFKPGN